MTAELNDPDFGTIIWEPAIESWEGTLATSLLSDAKIGVYFESDGRVLSNNQRDSERRTRRVPVTIHTNSPDDVPNRGQRQALAYLLKSQSQLEKALRNALSRCAKGTLRDGSSNGSLPNGTATLLSGESINRCVELERVSVHRSDKSRAPMSFAFTCGWDDEHGIELLMNGSKFLSARGIGEFIDVSDDADDPGLAEVLRETITLLLARDFDQAEERIDKARTELEYPIGDPALAVDFVEAQLHLSKGDTLAALQKLYSFPWHHLATEVVAFKCHLRELSQNNLLSTKDRVSASASPPDSIEWILGPETKIELSPVEHYESFQVVAKKGAQECHFLFDLKANELDRWWLLPASVGQKIRAAVSCLNSAETVAGGRKSKGTSAAKSVAEVALLCYEAGQHGLAATLYQKALEHSPQTCPFPHDATPSTENFLVVEKLFALTLRNRHQPNKTVAQLSASYAESKPHD